MGLTEAGHGLTPASGAREGAVRARVTGADPHFRARITFRRQAEGGRAGLPDLDEYRADLRFPFERSVHFSGQIRHAGKVSPGESLTADIWIRSAASILMTRVEKGTRFELMEGRKPVANGSVLTVFRRDD
jgi:translation elongation factor EF-Tu-like GTPase